MLLGCRAVQQMLCSTVVSRVEHVDAQGHACMPELINPHAGQATECGCMLWHILHVWYSWWQEPWGPMFPLACHSATVLIAFTLACYACHRCPAGLCVLPASLQWPLRTWRGAVL